VLVHCGHLAGVSEDGCCQGRSKCDPAAPVEKWTTLGWSSGCERSEGA
jgi:hypothetical protein